MIRTQFDLLYFLGVDNVGDIAHDVQQKTSTPTCVSVLRDRVVIGPMLDDGRENARNQVDLLYPFTGEDWQAAVEKVEEHSYKFQKKRSGMFQVLYSDLVDRPLSWCIDCGSYSGGLDVSCGSCLGEIAP